MLFSDKTLSLTLYNSVYSLLQIKWDQPALTLHNFIRGNDKLPGAWSKIDGKV